MCGCLGWIQWLHWQSSARAGFSSSSNLVLTDFPPQTEQRVYSCDKQPRNTLWLEQNLKHWAHSQSPSSAQPAPQAPALPGSRNCCHEWVAWVWKKKSNFSLSWGLTCFRAWLTVFSVNTGVEVVGTRVVAMHQARQRAEISQPEGKVISHDFVGFSSHC